MPQSLAVIGAGAVGCELAQVYAGFGSQVTLIEMLDRVVPTEDPEASDLLQSALKKQGISVLAGARATKLEDDGDHKRLVLDCAGETEVVEADLVLMATSRRAYIDGLGVEELGIALNRGCIVVNDRLQSSIENIYAAGDVRRGVGLAHLASHEGIVAVENALDADGGEPIDYDVVPAVIYTHPEIASVGLQEDETEDCDFDCQVGKFPFSALGRAAAYGARQGFVKLISEVSSGRIVGGTVVGLSASELIAEITLAVRMGLTLSDIAQTIHSHPTMSEAVGEAALAGLGRAIHLPPG